MLGALPVDKLLEDKVFEQLSERFTPQRVEELRKDYLKKSPARQGKWLNDVSWFLERQPDLLENFSVR